VKQLRRLAEGDPFEESSPLADDLLHLFYKGQEAFFGLIQGMHWTALTDNERQSPLSEPKFSCRQGSKKPPETP
jgi:hypothetical protein